MVSLPIEVPTPFIFYITCEMDYFIAGSLTGVALTDELEWLNTEQANLRFWSCPGEDCSVSRKISVAAPAADWYLLPLPSGLLTHCYFASSDRERMFVILDFVSTSEEGSLSVYQIVTCCAKSWIPFHLSSFLVYNYPFKAKGMRPPSPYLLILVIRGRVQVPFLSHTNFQVYLL